MNDSDTTPKQGSGYRVQEYPLATYSRGTVTSLSYQPGEIAKPEEITKPVPSIKKRWQDLGNGKGYFYIEINYILERLNSTFGNGKWLFLRTGLSRGEPDDKGQVEVIYEGVLLAPGLPECGIQGVGGDKWLPNNPMGSYANTIKSARADAIKDAARMLGVGLDVRDNPREGAALEAKQATIASIIKGLVDKGKVDAVRVAVQKVAPQALDTNTGEFEATLIGEDQLDTLQKELLRVANENSKVSV